MSNIKYINNMKIVRTDSYNYNFNSKNGYFERWGVNKYEDSISAPFPEILDLECTTICSKGCKFCYKSNTCNGINMGFDEFKYILDLLKPAKNKIGITQIAFGADYNLQSNPDLWRMMKYSRDCNVVPNITCAEVSDEVAIKLKEFCGAVAISRYDDKSKCYDSVKTLTNLDMAQINIHQLLAKETLPMIYETLEDIKNDPRLEKLNAIVFLSLKQKGRGTSYNVADFNDVSKLFDYCFEHNICFGLDSCGATKFLTYIDNNPELEYLKEVVEPCESSLFSSYINAEGKFFPCSFCENQDSWSDGIDVLKVSDFEKEVWNHPKTIEFKSKLLKCNRKCPIYNV